MCWHRMYWCDSISPVAPHYCRAVKRCSKNEKPLGLLISSIINVTNLFVIGECWWHRMVIETAKVDYSFWCSGKKAVGLLTVLFFSVFDEWKKSLKKNKNKKAKGAWQNKRFCDTFFFACSALKQRDANKLVFEIKGKGKKKKPKSKNLW